MTGVLITRMRSVLIICVLGCSLILVDAQPDVYDSHSIDYDDLQRSRDGCDFETGDCGFTQSDENLYWIINSGSTSSSDTGPSYDHTTETSYDHTTETSSGHYVYIETSSPASTGDTARLYSPTVKTTGSHCVVFYYHMYGATIGSLNIYAITSPSIGSPIWSMYGNQGNQWQLGFIQLYVSQKTKIIFEAVRGTSYTGDISLDDIRIQTGECSGDDAYGTCDRICRRNDNRTCIFDWYVSYYYTMLTGTGRPCGDCPFNHTDCSNEGCVTLNGIQRPVVTVNKQVPGPKMIVCLGDKIQVNVRNMLDDMTGITFHWHGMDQFLTPAMDGPSMITQCPIPYATTFTYKINANEPGTYFWHSHIGSNRADGLAGPIVIRQVNDPLNYAYDVDDSNHTIFLQDWMYITQNTNYMAYMYGVGHNEPDFLLINGKGKGPAWQHDDQGSLFYVPREVFYVEQYRRYRMRVISNAFTGCPMQLSIDNHSLLAINVDGFPIYPVHFDALITNAGERFDFILNANQPIGNYWLRVVGKGDNCATLQALAIIRYTNAPVEDPSAPERSFANPRTILNVPARWKESAPHMIKLVDLRAWWTLPPFVPTSDISKYYLPLGVENPHRDNDLRGVTSGLPQINHITFTFPPVPLLTQHNEVDQSLFCDVREANNWTESCRENQCKCTQMISVTLNQTVELFLYNANNSEQSYSCHPMHLHGFTYRIVGMGLLSNTNDTPIDIERRDRNGEFPRLKTSYPPYKDTACVSSRSYLIIQFIATHPGWWFFHCHLDFHTLIGMAMVVRVGTDEDLIGLIPENFPRCNNFYPPDM